MNSLETQIAGVVAPALETGLGSAAVVQVRHQGRVVAHHATGTLLRFDDVGLELDADERPWARPDTLFDLASLTKVVSTITLLNLVRSGALTLDAPIGEHLPTFRTGERGRVTLRHLLTHTSGLPAVWEGWRAPLVAYLEAHPGQAVVEWPDADAAGLGNHERLRSSLLRMELTHQPGTHFEYSCVGFNTAMFAAEAATSTPWAQLVHIHALEPLGLVGELSFGGAPNNSAATEVEPQWGRGVVWGQVHDESSWALGGRCANAGLFGTADAVATVGEAIRTGQAGGELIWDNALPALLGRPVADSQAAPYGQSLGLRIGQLGWMGPDGANARGHTGFTGTSLQIDREAELTIVVLTNRVHPTRDAEGINQVRAEIASAAYHWVNP